MGDESKNDRAVNVGVGAASPLWASFFMAAAAGVAYWGWTRWFKPTEAAKGEAPTNLAAPPAPTAGTPFAEPELSKPAPEPEPAPAEPAPDLATRLDRLLDRTAPRLPEEFDLAEAVCAVKWPNWPPYTGPIDQGLLRRALAGRHLDDPTLHWLGSTELARACRPDRE